MHTPLRTANDSESHRIKIRIYNFGDANERTLHGYCWMAGDKVEFYKGCIETAQVLFVHIFASVFLFIFRAAFIWLSKMCVVEQSPGHLSD